MSWRPLRKLMRPWVGMFSDCLEMHNSQAICDDTCLDPAIWPKGLDKYYCGDKCQEIWPTEVYRYTEAELRVTLHEVETPVFPDLNRSGLTGSLWGHEFDAGRSAQQGRYSTANVCELRETHHEHLVWSVRPLLRMQRRIVSLARFATTSSVCGCVQPRCAWRTQLSVLVNGVCRRISVLLNAPLRNVARELG